MRKELNNGEEKRKKIFNFFKHLLFYNVGIKLVSIFCAIFFWLLITNIADPYKSRTFIVQVQTSHEDAISSVHQVYEIVDGKTAAVTVRGRRSILDKFDESNIVASADLSELSKVNAVPIKASVNKHSADVTVECSQVLKISLENMESKQIKVAVNCEGTPSSGYAVGESVAKPNMIEVSGGESVIDRIASVEVTVNVNGASESFSKSVEPVAYDQKKHRITSATLSFNQDKVRAMIKLVQKKEVPVNIEIKGTPADGYEFVEFNSSPETIEVAGKSKYLEDISDITVPVDITGLTSDSEHLEQDIALSDYIDSHLSIPSEENQKVSVKISIKEMPSKTISLPVEHISLEGVSRGYTAELISATGTVSIVVKGTSDNLAKLDEESIRAAIDCSGYTVGRHSLLLQVALEDGYFLKDPVRVKVSIQKRR